MRKFLVALLAVLLAAGVNVELTAAKPKPRCKGSRCRPVHRGAPKITGTRQDGQTLHAHHGSWIGARPIRFAYRWQRCNRVGASCVAIRGDTSASMVLGSSDVGATIRVRVTARNAAGSRHDVSRPTRVVTAAPPRNSLSPFIAGTARDGQTVHASPGSWTGTQAIGFAYQWERCNLAGASCVAIGGDASASMALGSTDVGTTVRVRVTATNAAGSSQAVSAPTSAVAAKPPGNTAPPSITGTPRDGQTLHANPGSWSGTKPIRFAYQWQRCSPAGGSCVAVGAGTSASLSLDSTDVGATIRVRVTATNAAGSSQAVSAPTSAVAAIPPVDSALPAVTGTAHEGQTLTAVTGAWSGTTPMTFAYQWRRCDASGTSCVDIAAATAATYVLIPADDGATMVLAVTASNAAGSAEADSQPTAAVVDPQPAFPIRAAFYYPWFPEAWNQQGLNPFTHYTPSLGYYDSSATDVIAQHVESMEYGNIEAGISSWWGQGTPTDLRFPTLLSTTDALGSSLRWAIYYEPEGQGDPTVSQITDDLTYIRDTYASDPAYLRIGGRFVVFVYADPLDGCSMADRWQQANTVGAYVVLKVFPGYRTCTGQPDGWHQYAPAVAEDSQAGYSYTISPGFYKANEASPRLARDPTRWNQNIQDMMASGAPFQLVTTFNEWGEGTAVESAQEWATPSGFGAYLDALHDNGS